MVYTRKLVIPKTPKRAKGKATHVEYSKAGKFADWAFVDLHPSGLIDWRREAPPGGPPRRMRL